MNNKSKRSTEIKNSINPEQDKAMNCRLQEASVDYISPPLNLSNGEGNSLKRKALPGNCWIQPFGIFGNGLFEPLDFFTLEKRLNPKPELIPFRFKRSKQGKLHSRRRKKTRYFISRLKVAGQINSRSKK